MMEDCTLSAELQQLECDLSNRLILEASAGLRQRVLDDLRSRLRRERSRSRWQFALAVAATVLLWINLSMSATQATDYRLRLDGDNRTIEETADEIQRWAPELSAPEARREALLLQASSRLIPYPTMPTGHLHAPINDKGDRPWDTPCCGSKT
jgi:hypothetical protein